LYHHTILNEVYMSITDERRCESIAVYMLENACTVRDAAKAFGISKSTVHKDVTCNLKTVNKALFTQVRDLLETNKAERHFRGGLATRLKYQALKKADIKK